MGPAVSYPARKLSRAVNALSPEILAFMNAEQRIILVCDWDERIAAPAANLLFEKGADNVVLLSGGEHQSITLSATYSIVQTQPQRPW
jgi:centrosomal protein CEP41